MPPTYNSLVGYEEAVISGLTGNIRKRILRCLFESAVPMTRRMIEVQTHIRISTVTPAIFSLIEAGLVHKAFEGKDPISGYQADFLEPTWPQPVQLSFGDDLDADLTLYP